MMVSIVVPAYNESLIIQETLESIYRSLKTYENVTFFEIIVVDDHSSDNTFDQALQTPIENVKVIRLSQRCGSHTAIRAGLREARGNAIICISADGQDDPSAIPEMVKKWEMDTQIVWALRRKRDNEPLLVKLPALMFYKLLQLLTKEEQNPSQIDLSRADFYLLDQKVVDALNACSERNTSLFGLVNWSGFKQDYVEYDRKERRKGVSKWNFKSRMKLAKDWIIAFSGIPLRAMTALGFIIAFLGFAYALFVIFVHLVYGHSVEGWSSIMIVMLILGGLNISMLGVIGEYLWRNLDETRKRPLYFIEKKSKK